MFDDVQAPTEVVIVGAGPVGLVAACVLRQRDVRVRVLDRAAGPAETSRANILHARGVEVLNRAHALGDLREHANQAIRISLHIGHKYLASVEFGRVNEDSAALLISQAEIETRLRQRLAELGVAVEWNTELTGLDQDMSGVTASLRGAGTETTARSGWLLGCDGAHSTVRELCGIDFPGSRVTDDWLLADVHADFPADRSGSSGWLHPDGVLFAMPMPSPGDDRWRLMANVEAVDSWLSDAEVVDRLRVLLAERGGITTSRVHDPVWTSVFRIHRRLAERYRSGRVLLAGDAAHVHSPFGGQGMNTGIGDAENLAWKLAAVLRDGTSEAALDTYEAERRPLARNIVRNTTLNTRLLLGESASARLLRDRVFTPLISSPLVQRRTTGWGSQLWVHYRRGPLGGRRRGRGPRPGDRVSNVECTRPDGSTTRLHDELDGGWVLLGPAPVDEITLRRWGKIGFLVSPVTRGEWWLVRPDAHLAWRGPPHSSHLDDWAEAFDRGTPRR